MDVQDFHARLRPFLVALPAIGLAAGLAARAAGYDQLANALWSVATLPVLVVLLAEILGALRRGDVGLDVVAALSMAAALIFGEHLAAAVVALMYAGGQYLEAFAEKRARREMTALLSRVPRSAARYSDGELADVPLEAIAPGDRLLIRRGDAVPADGTVAGGVAFLDQSALTGEPMPVRHGVGAGVMSGSTNVGDAFDLLVTRRAADSTYAGIVRLVEQAERAQAPMARLADRFAVVFLVLTATIAAGAWIFSGDPIRAVAVLVVATPCPLILAVPVALVAGLSRAAREGILIKGGRALEAMARIGALVIDKTGTLTEGRAKLTEIIVAANLSKDEVLRLAASLDQASKHAMAEAIVSEARRRGLGLSLPRAVAESAGEGIEGRVDGRQVLVGGSGFVADRLGVPAASLRLAARSPGTVTVTVAVDGALAGELVLADSVRAGTAALLAGLRGDGIGHIVLASGDRRDVAEGVTRDLGFDAVHAELTPDRKIAVVMGERKHGPVMMVGDGVNDAPALAAADVGVAMGVRGAAASAEAADVVLLVDRLDRILIGLRIARRSRRIALESVYAGIGLSLLGMAAAAFGYLPPVQGAILQEIIDVSVILNALRALGDGTTTKRDRNG
ncbi:MAG TPA: heavy metal translocating P-type ATPase [Bauldia sp.]|nr:heavy metal translocating P-type ATPase [Bauldia sp.]